jgi:hypothetical protein
VKVRAVVAAIDFHLSTRRQLNDARHHSCDHLLILVLIGAIPNWGYSRGWGYGPSGIVGVILVVVLVLALLGRI